MKILINGREFESHSKPKMKHLRMGGRLQMMAQKLEHDPALMHGYIDEIYAYIKQTFPKVCDNDIDSMPTEKFIDLVKEISLWANGKSTHHQKKN